MLSIFLLLSPRPPSSGFSSFLTPIPVGIPDHLNLLLKEGVEGWNKFRRTNPEIQPDLRRADLSGYEFIRIDLNHADLSNADLSDAYLLRADFTEANLNGVNLTEVDLDLPSVVGPTCKRVLGTLMGLPHAHRCDLGAHLLAQVQLLLCRE